jgi:cell wall assembly regulator SMI1
MQKFTRALTREIELGGERLAVTLSEEGLTVRPVGARRPPHTLSWAACISAAVGLPGAGADELAEVVKRLKAGADKTSADASKSAAPEAKAAPTGPSLSATLAKLDAWIAHHRQRFHPALRPGATTEQVNNLNAELGGHLPGELCTLLSWHNGQDPAVVGGLEENWKLLSAEQISKAKKQLDAEAHDGWQKSWVPFMEDGNGNYLVLDASQSHGPVLDCWQGRAQHDKVAPSLAKWVEDFIAAAERGEYHEDSERGGFHRKD